MNPEVRALMVWSGDAGGVARHIADCSRHFPEHGITVRILCTRRGTGEPLGDVALLPGRFDSRASFRSRVRRYLADGRADVVVFHEHHAADLVLEGLSRPVPAACVMHSCRPDPGYYGIGETLWRAGVHLACVCEESARRMRERCPGNGPMIRTVHCGVDTRVERTCAPDPAGTLLRLVFAGRLAEDDKRISRLPLILQHLAAAGVPHVLTVIGDGPDRGALARAFARHLAEGTVRMPGALPHGRTLAELASAHVLLLCSRFEGLPLVLLEAMARGLVPVVPDLPGGIQELVREGETGFLWHTEANAAEALARLSREPGLFARIGLAAHSMTSDFALPEAMRRHADFLRAAATGPGTALPRVTPGWRERLADRLPFHFGKPVSVFRP